MRKTLNTEKEILLAQKEDDFIRLFDELVSKYSQSGVIFKTVELCKEVALMPAPRFYVTAAQASIQMRSNIYYGKEITKSMRRKMHEEIQRRYRELYDKFGGKAYQYTIMEAVVNQPAPSFYLEPDSAIKFYYTAMRHKRERARKC